MADSTWVWLISIAVSVLFFLGVPIFLIIGLWVVGISLVIDFTLANVGVTLYEGLNFYGLLALPLFILTGDFIKAAGIAQRLSDFAYSILGWLRGGLAMSALGACGLFAAISGSNSATTATIGSIMDPEMTKGVYDKHFAAATAIFSWLASTTKRALGKCFISLIPLCKSDSFSFSLLNI